MKILVTGRDGQVGGVLTRDLAPLGEVTATDRRALDLTDADAIARTVRELRPAVIVNAAAYTAVDRAEAEPALAQRVNGDAPGVLAGEARRLGALLVHYSTDYVFDGSKPGAYDEDDATGPLSVYGRSKLAGERAIAASGCRHLILRTAWVYGPRGNNFLLTMLRLARAQPELRVVDDQHGTPTSSLLIGRLTAAILRRAAGPDAVEGLFHLSAGGQTTWHGFASRIVALAGLATPVVPIPSSELRRPAPRPANSCLDASRLHRALGLDPDPWEDGLRAVMAAL